MTKKATDKEDTETVAPVIKPTIGRVVWYRAHDEDHRQPLDEQLCAALIAYVHDDTTVNLMVIGHDGVSFSKLDVPLAQGDEKCVPGGCMWMPYQKGQAAKTEALEKAAASKD